ncbi:MAG: hypothetical protein MUE73_13155 [Planctomycetes bacterium]|jgi:hypothetical protein|nr:hypothetical protein [Planctomycetota bacterium]
MDESGLRSRIEELTGRPFLAPVVVHRDTSDFMNVWRDHVLELEGRRLLVVGDMREGRFGIDDQPKFWVKRVLDLDTGDRRVLKLAFEEEFRMRIGLLRIRCYRSAEKEGRVLDLTRGDPRFMQGVTLHDERGNASRLLDFIPGENLYQHLTRLDLDHETWFHTAFPGILSRVLSAVEAIGLLHVLGLHHGDIRNDHILMDTGLGLFRWIDFDLCQDIPDYDVWCLGNVLVYVVGKGEHTFKDLAEGRIVPPPGPPLTDADGSAFFAHRIMNLRRLFPWIPKDLNDILMHFSFGTRHFYESVDEILADLRPVAARIGAGAPAGANP